MRKKLTNIEKASIPGPTEQRLVDEYLKKYPQKDEAAARERFLMKTARVFSPDMEQQKAINAIYDAMAAREQAEGPQFGHPLPPGVSWRFNPGAAERNMIDKFVARYSGEQAERFRATLMHPGAELSIPADPEAQKLLDAIYKIRRQTSLTEHKRNKGPQK